MRSQLALAALAAGAVFASGEAAAADCLPEARFAHPYDEPVPCSEPLQPQAPPTPTGDSLDLGEEQPVRPLRAVALSGLGSGASIAALGGVLALSSLGLEQGSASRAHVRGVGVGLSIAGGALFALGAALLGVDALAGPAPTPDRKGAALFVALRF